MSPRRNTTTGSVLEKMVLPALDQGGYNYSVQVKIGQRLGCGQHFADVVAEKDGKAILISMKWQQVSGTAEQKVPFEVICLLEAMESGNMRRRTSCLAANAGRCDTFTPAAACRSF